MVFWYTQSWIIKLCCKPSTKGKNKDSCPLNINRPCSYQAWYYHTSFIYLQALVIAMSPIFSLPKINESRLLEKLESKCSNVSKSSSVIEINLRKQYFVVLLWQIYFPTMVLQAIFWKFQENIFALKASAV